MTDWTEAHSELIRAVVERFPRIAWDRMPSTEEGLEALVDKVMASIPDVYIDSPDVGACYSARRLAVRWGITRQAIYQQRRTGRIIGFKNGTEYAYPEWQFGTDCRPMTQVREVLKNVATPPPDIAGFAAWLDTPDVESGQSPQQMIEAAARQAPTGRQLPKLSQVTIITREPLTRSPSDPSAE
jgi:hypothetical protein